MSNTKQPVAHNHWWLVTLLTAGHFLSDFYGNFLPPLLPYVMAKLGLSLTASGMLVMVYSFTSSMLQPVCGYFIDKSGFTWLILLTIPVSALFICSLGYLSSSTTLFVFVALSGLASSLFHPLGSSLIGKVSDPAKKGLSLSIFVGGGNIGFALAPAVLIAVIVAYGIDSLAWLLIPGILLPLAYYASDLHRFSLTTSSQITEKLETICWYKSYDLLKLNLVMALRSWSQVAVLTFLPVLLASQGHPPALAGNMLTFFLLGGALGGFGGGYLGDKLGHKFCLIGSLLICLPVLSLFLLQTEITTLSWILLGISGAALQGTVPSSIVWAQKILPGNTAMTSGMMLGLSFGLGGAGAAITGAIADSIGLQPALLWTLAPLALSVPLAWAISQEPTKATNRNLQSAAYSKNL